MSEWVTQEALGTFNSIQFNFSFKTAKLQQQLS